MGGALSHREGDRVAEIGQYVRRIEYIDTEGKIQSREQEGAGFGYRFGILDDAVIISVELELEPDSTESIIKRMRKAWIHRKAKQPLSFQATGKAFRNPQGFVAARLIEQANLSGAKVGGAQLSERNANYIVAHPGATARDILRLLDLIRTQVEENFQVQLEPEMTVW